MAAGGRRKRQNSNSLEARAALMRAAERCVAEHGLAGAPLTVIHKAAGQKNASAIHYHFGSRNGLISQILAERMPRLDADRMQRLDAIRLGNPGLPPLRDIIAVWVHPLANELHPRAEGNYYLRFLDRLRHDESASFAAEIVALQRGYRTIFALVSQHLAALPPVVRASRIALAAEQVIAGLAYLEAGIQGGAEGEAGFPILAIENLIDYIAGGLAAPVSAATMASLSNPAPVDFHLHFYEDDPGSAD